MRKGEPEQMQELAKELNLNLKIVDAKDRFYNAQAFAANLKQKAGDS